jgi:aspartate racemase
MKTIGLIGGMSWESSIHYYRIINERVRDRLGGLHSAKCILWSFDFAEITAYQRAAQWDQATARMIAAAQAVERAGAEVVLICTNTMHKMADEVQQAIRVPLLHIADPTAEVVQAAGVTTVGLLATKFTMEQDFYIARLAQRHGLKVIVPPSPERQAVHDIIFGELCQGKILDESRRRLQAVMSELVLQGAQGVILGCTELGLIIQPSDCRVPLFDTTVLHAEAAADYAIGAPAAAVPARAMSALNTVCSR